MKVSVRGNPDFGEATCVLDPGEKVLCEGRSMSRMSAHMELKVRTQGGLLRSAARAVAGGESFFLSEYSSDQGGFVTVVPGTPGAVVHRQLQGETLVLTAGSYLASGEGIDVRTKFGGLKSLFSGEGAFLLFAKGHGDLLFNAFGAIVERELDGELTVDSGHLVAWEPSLDYQVKAVGGLKQTLFSGEGLVMEFRGRGKVWLQTRTLKETAGWITPYLMS
ncbi:MAG: TIGR00266 family protein [Planctomycetota bacterium]|jgi:uncharacterized protein (TIGR00266 family)